MVKFFCSKKGKIFAEIWDFGRKTAIGTRRCPPYPPPPATTKTTKAPPPFRLAACNTEKALR